ncbi:[protein-PII] uridylyltransferase [Sphingomicrobium astaxanthinifaciens]|uniref:[protein-PII] uridylyltransferase n=1 Tax=Sphingomicrobium astaxanthinifaciens TaxID=1227949 RepID=UPI001FCC4E79|nr:[protein-PII] uridylyltransferase [Sphingomicrobium astaxanthinifaciens]MCJ7421342.1 [protein-PII] uridylyltransferase [Sphingomicrobium astaxanthinifaciens]
MLPPRASLIEDRRAIIDRRALDEALVALPFGEAARAPALEILGEALATGRAEIDRRMVAEPYRGRVHAAATSFLFDQLLRLAHDLVVQRLFPVPNPTAAERLALVGIGGTGRGEMAPHSDLDLLLLVPDHRTAWCEQAIEGLLYLLWDLQLKVGHAVRTPGEVIALSRDDMSVRTATLEARYIWGDDLLCHEMESRFSREIVRGTAPEFVAAKLAEREERHARMGDSRYLVEPNVKDGKGGLRDLHTLYWIGKYVHDVRRPAELVEKGMFSQEEFRRFERAERFLWSVRCHLHRVTGRAEDRLGFDHQREIAEAMNYADRPGKAAVERFMHFYFLNAKAVGDLTGVFLAQLDAQLAEEGRRFALPTLLRREKKLGGFPLDRGRLSVKGQAWLEEEPIRLLQLFRTAQAEGVEIHPDAMRAAARAARAVDAVREDPEANAVFLDILTGREATDTVLRWMNEAGVFGRFVPDFGRVVAQMQFDMYHHYTVDEHTIRAIGLTAAIDRGELAEDHPLASALIKQVASRRALYVAVLLHDIAKGRGGDHSELGAEIARVLGPRFGLTPGETDMVAWLVRHHLLMSATAFKRDLADPTTIDDFVRQVQSPERLRMLLILTVVDIRAVGPGTWTDWKRRLLRTLFEAAEERLRLGHKQHGRSDLVAARKSELDAQLDWPRAALEAHHKRLPDSYWLAEPTGWQVDNARQVAEAEAERALGPPRASIRMRRDADAAATRLSIFTPDAPGLFYRICAGLSAAGASIIGARIHTTRDERALDNLLIVDAQGRPYRDKRRRERLRAALRQSIESEQLPAPPAPEPLSERDAAFEVPANIIVSQTASTRMTVIEVHARDRAGLLARLAHAILSVGAVVHSAHVATYGERAVDTFYLTDDHGRKLDHDTAEWLRRRLADAAADPVAA